MNAKELPALQSELETLERGLSALLAGGDEQLLSWQGAVTSNLLDELAWLRRALVVDEVTFGDLPPSARQRLVAQDGASLTVIKPAHDISEVSALSEFIASVRSVAPQATGRPVVEWGVGGIVLSSFQQALLFAVVSITLVILLVMRSFRNTGLIILPLMLTAIGALAFGVLADQQVNMASILVWPLIFGLGVDNGIHVVDRYLGEGDVEHLMHSSTPRAVVLSTLTTFGAFAALSLSPHAGTASIGMLLAVSIGLLLLFTIFLLPVLLAKAGRQGMG